MVAAWAEAAHCPVPVAVVVQHPDAVVAAAGAADVPAVVVVWELTADSDLSAVTFL